MHSQSPYDLAISVASDRIASLSQLLAARVGSTPHAVAYVWVDDDGTERSLTYWELACEANRLAHVLRERGVAGKPVLLAFPACLEFVVAFFATVLAGAIAVPAGGHGGRHLSERIRGMLRDSGADLAITLEAHVPAARAATAADGLLVDWVSASEGEPAPYLGALAPPHEIAFLQYTSGSTAAPRGVVITHRNVLRCQENIRVAFSSPRGVTGVSWLPHFHDMGLIGGVLHPFYMGGRSILFAPRSFVRQPMLWLELISRHRAQISGAPNFAYELCAQRYRDGAQLGAAVDLSSWACAFNGAERVRHSTLRAFAEAFRDVGFSASALTPCYGLAESTLIVTGGSKSGPVSRSLHCDALARLEHRPAPENDRATRLVSCGAPVVSDLRIVCPLSDRELPAGQIGEVWVRDDSVSPGYWQRPDAEQAVFQGRVNAEPVPFLKTGDLGFIADGELFIAGRLKEVIISEGRNHYPEDLELSVEAVDPQIRRGGVAAFALHHHERELVVVAAELSRRADLSVEVLRRAVRRALANAHDLRVDEVIFVAPGSLPRTTSGKLRRSECRERFLAGRMRELEVAHV